VWFGGLLAYQSPERVRKCVFIGTAGLNTIPVGGVGIYEKPTREGLLRRNMLSVYPGSEITEEIAEELTDQQLAYANAPGAFEGLQPLVDQMANPASRRQFLLNRHLPYVKAPVLWLWGDRDTAHEPMYTWTDVFKRHGGDMSWSSIPVPPKSSFFMVPGTHMIQREKATEVSKYVIDFFLEGKTPVAAEAQKALA
jgi:pimeloyl-ACP methyl ester carboxylesterase